MITVSICCLTYNHRPYIKECLEGFLIQKCNFKFEVLIYDDASTDGTSEIILEYQSKFPDIIKPIIQIENQYSKGVRVNNVYNFSRTKGKYLALCEGDDYWTDPLKLQKQVDFLEQNDDFSICAHAVNEVDENFNFKRVFSKPGVYSRIEFMKNYSISTLSVVFRAEIFEVSKKEICINDYSIFMVLLQHKKLMVLDEIMGVHIEHSGGVWSLKNELYKAKFGKDLLLHFKKNFELSSEENEFISNKLNAINNFIEFQSSPLTSFFKGKIEIKYFIQESFNILKSKLKGKN